ncbi:MAG TPA: hypothetical protein VM818_09055 [Vicinamibacterales bacterium]|jgi:hypothetical protein|nr:hypothetical protein [Vicinamibacterales bacterium]
MKLVLSQPVFADGRDVESLPAHGFAHHAERFEDDPHDMPRESHGEIDKLMS